MTRIEADVTRIDDVEVFDKKVTIEVAPNDVVQPPDQPPPVEPDLSDIWGRGILALPHYPHAERDERDVVARVNNGKAYRDTVSELGGTPDSPGTAPVINTAMGTRGTVYLPDEGADGSGAQKDSAAMARALGKVKDGGKVFVPWGKWNIQEVQAPGHKDIIIEGETELGAELIGTPGRDMLVWREASTQRRLQNRPVIRNLRFGMRGNGQRGTFNRKTILGWQAGAAALAWIDGDRGDSRKGFWGNSYVTLQNVTAWADKNALGACLLYSDRPLYGLRATDIYIGHHGNDVSGTHGGIVFGKPPTGVMEATSDEMRIERMVHWGGQCSIAAYNVANGAVIDHKAYNCRHSLHLTGHDEPGPRDRCREIELRELYYDCEMVQFSGNDGPLIYIDSDGCEIGMIHIKGERRGEVSPRVTIKGEDVRGGQIRIMSSSRHASPVFDIAGEGHQFSIRAAGVTSAHKAKMVNDGRGHPGVTVR